MVTNKKIKMTESLQIRLLNGSKNLVIKIEKLMSHPSATKKHIKFQNTIVFSFIFMKKGRKIKFPSRI